MNTLLFLINIFVFLLCGGIFMVYPQITRKSFLFGVRIPPEEADCAEAAAMRKNYIAKCLFGIGVILAACIVQFVFWREYTLIATMYLPFLIMPLYFAAFVPNHKKAARLKEERGWAVSSLVFADTKTAGERGRLSAIPWAWYIAAGVLAFASIVVAAYRMPNLPDLIPVHFNAAGVATRYAPPTFFNVMIIPLMNVGMVALFAVINIVFEKLKMQIDTHAPAKSFAQHKIYRRRMGHAMGFYALALVSVMSPVGLVMIFPDAEWARGMMQIFASLIVIFSFVGVVPLLVVHVKSGQGGGKIKVDLPEESETPHQNLIKGRGDDKHWKLGMFYYNPDDPAIFVEDRFGGGSGLNFARASSKIFVAVVIIGLIVTYALMTPMLLDI